MLRAEGWRAARDRTLDRLAEARRRRAFTPAEPGFRAESPVLEVGAHPPAARFGGVQAQWGARIAAEEILRPVAVLYPEGQGLRLELSVGPEGPRRAITYPSGRPSGALADPAWEATVRAALGRTGARALKVEGAAGLPLESLLRLARDVPTLLALHDFALFCRRPHLFEEPLGRFCEYCRDLPRCAACLGGEPDSQRRWREAGAALLTASAAVVYPSQFLARTHRELFGPEAWGGQDEARVIPPAQPTPGPLPGVPPSGPVRHLALVGGVQRHKGAQVFLELVDRLGPAQPKLRWSAYGGGDPALLAALRSRRQVRVRGYYRLGTLPRLLREDRVDLALLPSIVPESFSLVLSECRAASVPVVAFRLGAVADRLEHEGGGLTVPLIEDTEGTERTEGASGLAALLTGILRGEPSLPHLSGGLPIPSPAEVARRWLDLYRELGLPAPA
ncbi:MAG TPA: glycosyltransferase [Thermoanaerobaculia bacterium]|nr:glycosyltransferase [Thermoanaerobaculia bacterium]